jgi:hypothetical protein
MEVSEKVSEHSHHEHSDGSTVPVDLELEKKLVRKIDIRLIPILCLLLLCAFLDRYSSLSDHEIGLADSRSINIGNARLVRSEDPFELVGLVQETVTAQ